MTLSFDEHSPKMAPRSRGSSFLRPEPFHFMHISGPIDVLRERLDLKLVEPNSDAQYGYESILLVSYFVT